jgi:small subunit ribosomal protein S18
MAEEQKAAAPAAPAAPSSAPPRRDGGGGHGHSGGGHSGGGHSGGGHSGGGHSGPRREGGPGGGGPGGPRRGKRQYFRKKKVCKFCVEKMDFIDYKRADILSQFVQERGKILPRRMTGVCSRHQRWLGVAIKRARNIALLPFAGSAAGTQQPRPVVAQPAGQAAAPSTSTPPSPSAPPVAPPPPPATPAEPASV